MELLFKDIFAYLGAAIESLLVLVAVNYTGIAVFLFGACVGSFLNVCIHRLPNRQSLLSPPSRCTHCGRNIRFYDNIPILSYIMLGARCRYCRAPVSPVYPAVELLSALLALGLYVKFGITFEFFVYAAFTAALIVVSFIDFRLRIIPSVITIPGTAIAFAVSVYVGRAELFSAFLWTFTALVVGGGVLLAIGVAYQLLTGKEAMGMGDVKLMAMIGALLGIKGVIFVMFVSSVAGAVLGGISIMALGKRGGTKIPFGPYISLAALIYVFFGERIIEWYITSIWGL